MSLRCEGPQCEGQVGFPCLFEGERRVSNFHYSNANQAFYGEPRLFIGDMKGFYGGSDSTPTKIPKILKCAKSM